MTKKKKPGEPWLMACALLGPKRLKVMMKNQKLTLEEAEAELRGQVEECLKVMNGLRTKGWPKDLKISWHPTALPARDAWLNIYIDAEQEGKIKKRSPRLKPFEIEGQVFNLRENRFKPFKKTVGLPTFDHGGDFRVLWSWLVDEGSDPGGKLVIATAFEKGSTETRSRRIKQLKADSKMVLGALEILKNPHRVRRRSVGGEMLHLAKLSIAQQDQKDEDKTLREMALRLKLKEAKSEVRRIQAELMDFLRLSQKTGR
jgi:hypothetical protein